MTTLDSFAKYVYDCVCTKTQKCTQKRTESQNVVLTQISETGTSLERKRTERRYSSFLHNDVPTSGETTHFMGFGAENSDLFDVYFQQLNLFHVFCTLSI